MAYEFTAASSQRLSATAPITTAQMPYTLACWFLANDVTTNRMLISLNVANGNFAAILANGAFAGDPILVFHSSASAEARTTAGYAANTWTHACGVFSSTTSRTAYINGGNSGTNTVGQSSETSTELLIGARRFGGALGTYHDGLIAEVGIWNAALTAEEIASLAKGMTCDKVRPQSLVFYAPLVRDLIDQKGGLTITNNNGATVANHTRVYA
jgi:hypothetical protein